MVEVDLIGALRTGLKSNQIRQKYWGQWYQEAGAGGDFRKVKWVKQGKEERKTLNILVIWNTTRKRGIREGREILGSFIFNKKKNEVRNVGRWFCHFSALRPSLIP